MTFPAVTDPRLSTVSVAEQGRLSWARRAGAAIAVLAALLMSLAGLAGPANASSSLIYTQPGHSAALATCYAACGTIGAPIYPPNNTGASMFCYYDASGNYTGNYTSNRWFVVSIDGHPGQWWIHSSYVYYQTGVARC